MIGVLAEGRLGNQMFQYAFAYATSKKLNTSFFIYGRNYLHYFDLYEKLKKENTKNTFAFILHNIFKKSRKPYSLRPLRTPIKNILNWSVNKNVRIWGNTIDEKNYLLTKVEDNVFYDGFFQSEEYYSDCKEEIKKLFEIREHYQNSFLERKKQLFDKKCISIHIRRGDYLTHGGGEIGGTDMTLPISYYKNALSLIKNSETYNVIFVSDDIDFVKKEFGDAGNYFYESNDEITDFQLLLNSDILIIANSSFSWWAAWLNKKTDKIIYAPNYFMGFKVKKFYPAGIKVNAWNWIDIN